MTLADFMGGFKDGVNTRHSWQDRKRQQKLDDEQRDWDREDRDYLREDREYTREERRRARAEQDRLLAEAAAEREANKEAYRLTKESMGRSVLPTDGSAVPGSGVPDGQGVIPSGQTLGFGSTAVQPDDPILRPRSVIPMPGTSPEEDKKITQATQEREVAKQTGQPTPQPAATGPTPPPRADVAGAYPATGGPAPAPAPVPTAPVQPDPVYTDPMGGQYPVAAEPQPAQVQAPSPLPQPVQGQQAPIGTAGAPFTGDAVLPPYQAPAEPAFTDPAGGLYPGFGDPAQGGGQAGRSVMPPQSGGPAATGAAPIPVPAAPQATALPADPASPAIPRPAASGPSVGAGPMGAALQSVPAASQPAPLITAPGKPVPRSVVGAEELQPPNLAPPGTAPAAAVAASDPAEATQPGPTPDASPSVQVATSTAPAEGRPAIGFNAPIKVTPEEEDEAIGSFMDNYLKVGAPKMVEFYLSTGDVDKAKAFDDWTKEAKVQQTMKLWAKGVHAAAIGDENGMFDSFADYYNTFDDGLTVNRKGSGFRRDKDGNIEGITLQFTDDKTGESFTQELDGVEDLVHQGIYALAPEKMFEVLWGQMEKAQEIEQQGLRDDKALAAAAFKAANGAGMKTTPERVATAMKQLEETSLGFAGLSQEEKVGAVVNRIAAEDAATRQIQTGVVAQPAAADYPVYR